MSISFFYTATEPHPRNPCLFYNLFLLLWNDIRRNFITFSCETLRNQWLYYLLWNSGDLCSIPGRVLPKTQKWYLIPSCLTLSNIRVKWSNPGKGVLPSPTSRCSSYWKGSLLVALDYGYQLYYYYIYIYIYIYRPPYSLFRSRGEIDVKFCWHRIIRIFDS